jgi:hypothetical protein
MIRIDTRRIVSYEMERYCEACHALRPWWAFLPDGEGLCAWCQGRSYSPGDVLFILECDRQDRSKADPRPREERGPG